MKYHYKNKSYRLDKRTVDRIEKLKKEKNLSYNRTLLLLLDNYENK